MDETELVTLVGQVTDPDADPFTCDWEEVSSSGVTLEPVGPCAVEFTAPVVPLGGQVLTFALVATDCEMASAQDHVNVTVRNVRVTGSSTSYVIGIKDGFRAPDVSAAVDRYYEGLAAHGVTKPAKPRVIRPAAHFDGSSSGLCSLLRDFRPPLIPLMLRARNPGTRLRRVHIY